MKKATVVSTIAVFASFNAVLDSIIGPPLPVPPSVWHSWIFMATPITGIVLGPYAGFLSSLIGVMIGHFIYFIDPYEFLFTLGAPMGAMIAGFLFRGRWKVALAYYTVMLAAYFATPISWQLPLWGMWDVYVAYGCVLATTVIMRRLLRSESRELLFAIAVCTFIGLEADVLFRIFIFIPGQTYRLFYGLDIEVLRSVWRFAAIETGLKAAVSTVVTAIVGPSLIRAIKKTPFSSWLSRD